MRQNMSVSTIALAAAWLSVCLNAQQSPSIIANESQAKGKPFTLLQTTREVDLDIVATDSTGQPIRGLTKDDFQIFEDHKPQRASSFEAYTPDLASPVVAAPKLPEGTFTNYVPAGNGHVPIVILLDSLDTPLEYQLYAYRSAIDFIKQLPAGVDVALFTLNARMELLQGFTSDINLLLETMRSRRAMPNPSYLIDSAPGLAIVREGSNDVYRKQLLLDGMATLGRYLAGFPGRKNLIWLTVDIPGHENSVVTTSAQTALAGADAPSEPTVSIAKFGELPSAAVAARPGAAIQNTAGSRTSGQPSGAAGEAGLSLPAAGADTTHTDGSGIALNSIDDLFDTTGGALALGRVAVYILDPRALMTPVELAGNPDWRFQFAEMDHAAEATGGHAFYNSNRLDLVMDQIVAEGSNYYRLTYLPTNRDWDGAFRHLQLKIASYTRNPLTSAVTRKPAVGPLHLSYRHGYYASDTGAPALGGQPSSTIASDTSRPTVFTLAAEDRADGLLHIPRPQKSLQASMTMGELSPTEILFVASVKAADSIVQQARNSPLPPDDFMRARFRNQPYRKLNIVFATNAHSLALPVATDGLRHGRVEFVTVIYNNKGDVVNSLITNVSLDLRETSYRKMLETGIGAHQSIAVPVKGEYILRLGVHDITSDRIGAEEIPLSRIKTSGVGPASPPATP